MTFLVQSKSDFQTKDLWNGCVRQTLLRKLGFIYGLFCLGENSIFHGSREKIKMCSLVFIFQIFLCQKFLPLLKAIDQQGSLNSGREKKKYFVIAILHACIIFTSTCPCVTEFPSTIFFFFSACPSTFLARTCDPPENDPPLSSHSEEE